MMTEGSRLAHFHSRIAQKSSDFGTAPVLIVAAHAQAICSVGRRLKVCVADVYAAWEKASIDGINTDDWLVNGFNHLTAEAHHIPTKLLLELIVGL